MEQRLVVKEEEDKLCRLINCCSILFFFFFDQLVNLYSLSTKLTHLSITDEIFSTKREKEMTEQTQHE
jgi:hypothetical protein